MTNLPENMRRIAFDIETYSTQPNAVVLSIGLVWFDLMQRQTARQLKKQSLNLPLKYQEQNDRHLQSNTIEWWDNQHPAAVSAWQDACYPYTTREAKNRIDGWIEANKLRDANWFCRGPHFDATILMDLFGERGPIKFWKVRDTRTLLDAFLPDWRAVEEEIFNTEPLTKHIAQHDAIAEAMMQQRSKEKLLTMEAPALAHQALVHGGDATKQLIEVMAW